MRREYEEVYEFIEEHEPVSARRIQKSLPYQEPYLDDILENMKRSGTVNVVLMNLVTADGELHENAIAYET